ncbi:PilZ domain-containing protein [Paludibacterium paludis]|uniref:Type IV fimbriae assembly protein n=1 Tax=Paludibacterium paludis TaxID=1225769 RepID=A0A918P6Q2_9NEIS|nr:PilZ domain-containing protein [Paludibacterium paludis]GGY27413.1 type IV fimbriae assembly protein [Paludibacterium paludis]
MSDATYPTPAVLSLALRDRDELYASYMPFVPNGGLFVPTAQTIALGRDVLLEVTLPDGQDRLELPGTVVWITPSGAHNGREPGLGVAFRDVEATRLARRHIETLLGGVLNSSRPTHTV